MRSTIWTKIQENFGIFCANVRYAQSVLSALNQRAVPSCYRDRHRRRNVENRRSRKTCAMIVKIAPGNAERLTPWYGGALHRGLMRPRGRAVALAVALVEKRAGERPAPTSSWSRI